MCLVGGGAAGVRGYSRKVGGVDGRYTGGDSMG